MINSSRGKSRSKNVKFSEKPKGDFKRKNESNKKDPRGPRCHECSGYGHIWVDSGNLKQSKGRAFKIVVTVF
jgi:hypothetical protein